MRLSRSFYLIVSILIIITISTPCVLAGYNYYIASIYNGLAESAMQKSNYQSAVDFFQTSLVYRLDDEVANDLLEAEDLEKSTLNFFLALRILSQAQNKEDYQRSKDYFSKVIKNDFQYNNAQEKISFCNQKIAEFVEAENQALIAADTSTGIIEKQTQPSSRNNNTEQPSTDLDPPNNTSTISMQRVKELVNAERQRNGLQGLADSAILNQAAANKANHMYSNGYCDHCSPDGSICDWDFGYQLGYPDHNAANLACGWYQNEEALVSAWMNSSGHRSWILNPTAKYIGFGFYSLQRGLYALYLGM